ncbi:MAG: thermonuclease family protein [Terricaulis sp.]
MALIVVLVLVVTLALIVWTRSAGAQPLREIVGIASVIDGDTIEVHDERIRLSGFDAPERGRRCAGGANAYQSASLALSDFIGRRTVHCALSGTDNYGRHVGTCRVDGVDLGEHMVSQGWARDWPRYSHRAYADDEAQARAAHRGLWAMNCPSLWGDRNYD